MENEVPQNADQNRYMSRRERRELMRSQGTGKSVGGGGNFRRVLLWGGAVAAILLVGWGMVKLSQRAPSSGNGTLSVAVNEKDNIRGPADAKVTLVEYSDFQCPACAAFFPIIKKAFTEPELKDHIRIVYRYFPLTSIHPNAQLSAQAGQAAALQGKFWEMHDMLFDKQDTWAPLSAKAAKDAFADYAQQVGMDKNRFLSDIDSDNVKDRVRTDVESGSSSGVNSTPTFYVNWTKMTQPNSYDEFKQNLINVLNAAQ